MKSALISACDRYRYRLTRTWDRRAKPLVWIMLNPSTADAEVDDPTIRRCRGFARRWGYGGIVVTNLYAFRATQPRVLFEAPDPVGPDNDRQLVRATRGNDIIVGWGKHARPERVRDVRHTLRRQLHCLCTNQDGSPRHPLYVPNDTSMQLWKRWNER